MSRIGIIDDDKEQRETLKSILESHLENFDSSIEVVDTFPFSDDLIANYKEWIEENEIVCLSLWTYIPNHGVSAGNSTTATIRAYQSASIGNKKVFQRNSYLCNYFTQKR